MKSLKLNALMILAAVIFAVFAGLDTYFSLGKGDFYLPPTADFCDSSIDDESQNSPLFYLYQRPASSVLFESRRGSERVSFRSQRGGISTIFCGRDGCLHEGSGFFNAKLAFFKIPSNVFSSPIAIRYPKDYYVYTLKRILC